MMGYAIVQRVCVNSDPCLAVQHKHVALSHIDREVVLQYASCNDLVQGKKQNNSTGVR